MMKETKTYWVGCTRKIFSKKVSQEDTKLNYLKQENEAEKRMTLISMLKGKALHRMFNALVDIQPY